MIIGISGKRGSGKSTLCKLLIEKLAAKGIIAEKKSFAGKLKEITAIISGLDLELMYTQEGKNIMVPSFGLTVGQMQQKIGTEVMRDNFDKDVWVKALLNSYTYKKDVWIIEDVRFENEAEAIRKMPQNVIFRLNGDPAGINKNSTRDLSHPSETSLDDYEHFDLVIDNSIQDISKLEILAEGFAEKFSMFGHHAE